MARRHSQCLRGVLDLAVLAALHDRERYGYEIAQRLESAGLGPLKGGTLYPLLGRLEKAQLVEPQWRPGEQGPGRKYYALTPDGRRFLRDETEEWDTFVARTAALLDGRGST